MKALVLKEYKKFSIEERPVPSIEPDEVLVRVRACGICGSDVHGMDGSTGRRIPPLVMGHEAAGEIARVGRTVADWKEGDRVTFDSTVYCGTCWHCLRGEVNLCENRRVLGVSCAEYRRDGAFAEYVAVPSRILYRLPQGLGFEAAAMVEAVSVAAHAVRRTGLPPRATTVVVGAGMIGLLVVQVLRVEGCSRIVAIDRDPERLRLAARFGATHTIQADDPELPRKVIAATSERGADAAFEVVGISAALQTAVGSVRKGGSVTLVGNLAAQVNLPLQAVVTRELKLIGSCASAGEYPAALEMIASGQVDVSALMSATASLDEGPGWFERLHAGEPGLMKVLLKP